MRTSINELLASLFNAVFDCGWHAARGKGKQEGAARKRADALRDEILQRFSERGITIRLDTDWVSGKLIEIKVDNP